MLKKWSTTAPRSDGSSRRPGFFSALIVCASAGSRGIMDCLSRLPPGWALPRKEDRQRSSDVQILSRCRVLLRSYACNGVGLSTNHDDGSFRPPTCPLAGRRQRAGGSARGGTTGVGVSAGGTAASGSAIATGGATSATGGIAGNLTGTFGSGGLATGGALAGTGGKTAGTGGSASGACLAVAVWALGLRNGGKSTGTAGPPVRRPAA